MGDKKGQQEIVGFVLIVVLVVIGLMFSLIYSFSDKDEIKEDDISLGNLMSSILDYTTDCSVDGEKQTVLDLLTNCESGKGCDNDERTSCELLQEELELIIAATYQTESSVDGVTFDYYIDKDGLILGIQSFEKISVGNCTTSYLKSFEQPIGGVDDAYVLISVC